MPTVMAGEEKLKAQLTRGLAGDARAYEAFLGDLARHLRGFLRKRLVRLPDEVEDLVQETLLAVHNQRHTYDPAQPVTAWVVAIARYKLVDCLRHHGRRDARFEALDEDHEAFAITDDAAAEAQRDLGKLLETLPEKMRVSIVHTKLDGLSVAETAAKTGLSESAIKVNVHRGLKALAAGIQRLRDAN